MIDSYRFARKLGSVLALLVVLFVTAKVFAAEKIEVSQDDKTAILKMENKVLVAQREQQRAMNAMLQSDPGLQFQQLSKQVQNVSKEYKELFDKLRSKYNAPFNKFDFDSDFNLAPKPGKAAAAEAEAVPNEQ